MAIFELVADSRNATITISAFTISKSSLVLMFIPPIVSYIYLQISLDGAKHNRLLNCFDSAFEIWSDKAWENDLDNLLSGPQPAYWNTGMLPSEDQSDRIEYRLSITFTVLIILGFIAFEAQAYCVLFPQSASTAVMWALSLLITIFCGLLRSIGRAWTMVSKLAKEEPFHVQINYG
jgi:hypothetical protein